MHLTRFMLFVTVAAVLSPGTAVATDEALLAADGTARMPIVISPHASPDTQAVAAELADYLKRITGAAFTVTAGDGAKGIVLGTIHEFPNPAFAKALEIRDGVDGKEAYAISTGKTRVLLLGGADLGVSHAAYRFLESLGCRWYFPAQEWEVVPAMSRLAVALEEVDRPVILSRRIWYMNFYEPETGNRAIRDAQAWARRNRMASSRGIQCGHAWQSIIADNQAVFAAHPEYRALTGGKRQGEQLCVSNPAVRTLAIDWCSTNCARIRRKTWSPWNARMATGNASARSARSRKTFPTVFSGWPMRWRRPSARSSPARWSASTPTASKVSRSNFPSLPD